MECALGGGCLLTSLPSLTGHCLSAVGRTLAGGQTGSTSGRGAVQASWSPCSCGLPSRASSSAPAPLEGVGSAPRHDWVAVRVPGACTTVLRCHSFRWIDSPVRTAVPRRPLWWRDPPGGGPARSIFAVPHLCTSCRSSRAGTFPRPERTA